MTAPAVVDTTPDPPDFSRLDRAAKLLQSLSAIKGDDPRFAQAQVLFGKAHDQFLTEAQNHAAYFKNQNQAEQAAAQVQPDLGPEAAARLGGAQGLAGSAGGIIGGAMGSMVAPGPGTAVGAIGGSLAGGYLAEPLTRLAAAFGMMNASPDDVHKQWAKTAAEHPGLTAAGIGVGGLIGGGIGAAAGRYFGAAKSAQLAASQAATGDATAAKLAATKQSAAEAHLDILRARLKLLETKISGQQADPLEVAAKKLGLSPDQLAGARSPSGQAIVDQMKGGAAANPLIQTADEAAATAGKKGATDLVQGAARTAYILAKEVGRSDAEALELSRRAAAMAMGQ